MSPATSQTTPFVERTGDLYTLPSVAVEVLELTNHPKIDIRALKVCIENDPALTVKILRVVNSSLFGLSREVSDLNQALALLGTTPLKLLVLGFSLSESLFSGMTGKVVDRYWRRTLTKAIAAREIAETIWRVSGDEPFLTALLEDVGLLVLVQELGQPYTQLLERVYNTHGEILACERQSLGFDHRQLSAELLERWHLPDSLVAVVRHRAGSLDLPALPLAARSIAEILHLAGLLAELLVEARYAALRQLLDAGADRHRMSQAQLSELVAQLQTKVADLADVLSIDLPAGVDYRDVLVQAHGRLSQVAAGAVGELILQQDRGADTTGDGAPLLGEMRGLSAAMDRFLRRGPEARLAVPALPIASRPNGAAIGTPMLTTARGEAGQERLAGEAIAALASAVASCRQARRPLSLALVQVDRMDALLKADGPVACQRYGQRLKRACELMGASAASCWPVREGLLAVVLPDCDRRQAVELGNRLVRNAERVLGAASDGQKSPPTLSVGLATVAVPPKNFSPGDLVEKASRCLSAARLCGGSTLKSIDVY